MTGDRRLLGEGTGSGIIDDAVVVARPLTAIDGTRLLEDHLPLGPSSGRGGMTVGMIGVEADREEGMGRMTGGEFRDFEFNLVSFMPGIKPCLFHQ